LNPDTRRSLLTFLLLSLLATVLIGVGLPRLNLGPGLPLPAFEQGVVSVPVTEAAPVGMPVPAFAGIVLLFLLAAFLILAIVLAARGVRWKALLALVRSVLWKVALVAAILMLIVLLLPKSAPPSPVEEPLPPPKPLATAPLGAPPAALIWIVGICFVAGLAVLAVRLAVTRERVVAVGWQGEAEKARQALLAGEDMGEVIVRCYQRMSEALIEERQIEREPFMTTGEFETVLTAKGVPCGPVHQLTQLFDSVRYGRLPPQPGDEQRALQCLEAIVQHNRS
jgi:hypothetical protein